MFASRFINPWLDSLSHGNNPGLRKNCREYWSPDYLVTSSTASSFSAGTGANIFSDIQPELLSAENEIIFVTCFWARSESLNTLCDVLRQLSWKAIRRGNKKIRVHICFSSLSIFQKIFHTASADGRVYVPSTWATKLGLPKPEEIGGLELCVKSVFIRPFSVMHPKFIIIDRETVLVPSCNVSWEPWFEGCIKLSGDVVSRFFEFWRAFWARREAIDDYEHVPPTSRALLQGSEDGGTHPEGLTTVSLPSQEPVPTIFLPSTHNVNPRFRPFPWTSAPLAPRTPLNTFLLHLFVTSQKDIYIQTPNLTAPPVLKALLICLKRGINVKIVTNDRLMVLEQLVTAGTTTARCMKWLVKRHKRAQSLADVEANRKPGDLTIYYWGTSTTCRNPGEAQRSHLKLAIVDMQVSVLGSGNMDRASWYTSQELGVALMSSDLAGKIWAEGIEPCLEERCRLIYSSAHQG